MIKAIFFSVFGTLVDWRTAIIKIGKSFSHKENLNLNWERIADEWKKNYYLKLNKINSRNHQWNNLDIINIEILEKIIKKMNLNFLRDSQKEKLLNCCYNLKPWSDCRETIIKLNERFITATLSNGHLKLQKKLIKNADLNIEIIFSSEHFKKYKPNKIVYISALKYLGLKASECILISSHEYDLQAASRIGLKTIFLKRQGVNKKNYHYKNEIKYSPDFQIKSLIELDNILV